LVHHYVLGNFAKDEQEGVRDLCEALADPLALLLEGQDSAYQQAVNAAMD
jgi:peptidyl-tRNA hydrolase